MELKVKLTKEDLYSFYQHDWESYWLWKIDSNLFPLDIAYGRILQNIVDLIPFHRDCNFTVLDMGCGVGIYSINILKKFPKARLTGVDLSEKQILIANDLSNKHEISDRAEFIYGDAEEWITEDNYDLIICTEVLEHLLEPRKALDNMLSMSTENGSLIFSVPQIYGNFGSEGIFYKKFLDDGKIIETMGKPERNGENSLSYWHKAYKLNEIKNLLSLTGFLVEIVLGSTFKFPLKDSSHGALPIRFCRKGQNITKKFLNRIALQSMSNKMDVMLNRLTNYKYAETLILRCRKTNV